VLTVNAEGVIVAWELPTTTTTAAAASASMAIRSFTPQESA